MPKSVRYALKRIDGTTVGFRHQDDLETPIIGNTIPDLITEIEDWNGGDIYSIVETLDPETGKFTLDTGDGPEEYEIIREEYDELRLTADDLAVVRQIVEEETGDE